MNRRDAQKAETRTRLIEVARRSFLDLGYDKTTLAGVARAASVAVGTVCLHFPTKSDLVAAAFLDQIDALIEEGGASVGPLEQALPGRVRPLYRFYATHPAVARAFLRETLFLEGAWGDRISAQVLGFVAELQALLEADVERGVYAPSLDTGLAARGIFGDYFQVLLHLLHTTPHPPDEPEPLVEVCVAQLESLTAQRLAGFQGEGT